MFLSRSIRINFLVFGLILTTCLFLAIIYSIYQFYFFKKNIQIFNQKTTQLSLSIGRIEVIERETERILKLIYPENKANQPHSDYSNFIIRTAGYLNSEIIKEYKTLKTFSRQQIKKSLPEEIEKFFHQLIAVIDDLEKVSNTFDFKIGEALIELGKTNYKSTEIASALIAFPIKRNDRLISELTSIEDSILKARNAQMINIDLLFMFLFFLLLILSVIFLFLKRIYSQQIMNPLEKLIDFTKKIEEREPADELFGSGSKEFDSLFSSITKMEKSISSTENNLKRKTSELKSVNNELSHFSHSIAHDLKDPICTAIGMCDLARTSSKIDRNLDSILKRIQSLLNNTNDSISGLLDFSETESIHLLDLENIDLNSVAKLSSENLALQIESSNTNIEISSLPHIKGKFSLWVQVFQNIIANSIKFKSTQNPRINIFSEHKENWTSLYFKDNGIGIDLESKDKIFQFSYKETGIEKNNGYGIGLSTVKRIVDKYGGQIELESSPGSGTTFEIRLPNELIQPPQV